MLETLSSSPEISVDPNEKKQPLKTVSRSHKLPDPIDLTPISAELPRYAGDNEYKNSFQGLPKVTEMIDRFRDMPPFSKIVFWTGFVTPFAAIAIGSAFLFNMSFNYRDIFAPPEVDEPLSELVAPVEARDSLIPEVITIGSEEFEGIHLERDSDKLPDENGDFRTRAELLSSEDYIPIFDSGMVENITNEGGSTTRLEFGGTNPKSGEMSFHSFDEHEVTGELAVIQPGSCIVHSLNLGAGEYGQQDIESYNRPEDQLVDLTANRMDQLDKIVNAIVSADRIVQLTPIVEDHSGDVFMGSSAVLDNLCHFELAMDSNHIKVILSLLGDTIVFKNGQLQFAEHIQLDIDGNPIERISFQDEHYHMGPSAITVDGETLDLIHRTTMNVLTYFNKLNEWGFEIEGYYGHRETYTSDKYATIYPAEDPSAEYMDLLALYGVFYENRVFVDEAGNPKNWINIPSQVTAQSETSDQNRSDTLKEEVSVQEVETSEGVSVGKDEVIGELTIQGGENFYNLVGEGLYYDIQAGKYNVFRKDYATGEWVLIEDIIELDHLLVGDELMVTQNSNP